MVNEVNDFLSTYVTAPYGHGVTVVVTLIGIAMCAVTAYYLARGAESIFTRLIAKTETTWDDDLLEGRFLRALAQLAPALVVNWLLPMFFGKTEQTFRWVELVTDLYILWIVVLIVNTFIDNLFEAFHKRENLQSYAVKGLFQMVKLIVIGLGAITTISLFAHRSPMAILTALGASAAILMLVFKDTILGLVASIQLTANNMVKRDDWIIVDKHNANGEVIDISLTTVKVRNWDNSITTIPPYSLVSESFRNYQPMRDAGGRRVDRSILIDANSVRFCSAEELDRLDKAGWLDGMDVATAKRQVNLQLLRTYLEKYLSEHELVNQDMLHMVRQMEPTSMGLPLQLYFFTIKTEWKAFEKVQSDIFDHVYAVIHEFGLRVYQVANSKE